MRKRNSRATPTSDEDDCYGFYLVVLVLVVLTLVGVLWWCAGQLPYPDWGPVNALR